MTNQLTRPPTTNSQLAGLDAEERRRLLWRLRQRAESGSWFLPTETPSEAGGVTLYCFPYAGVGASIYRAWQHAGGLAPGYEVLPVQPPGRENRLAEPAHRRMPQLIDDLIASMSLLPERPFAFFGHSMGALIAYELACALRERGLPQPTQLFLSAFRAPHLPSANIRIHQLPDEVLKIVLQKDGIAPAVLDNDDLMNALLPTLRADLELCDTYEYTPRGPLDIPISVFGGDHDVRVAAEDLAGWRAHTTAEFELVILPGNHFYLHSARERLVSEIAHRSPTHQSDRSIHEGDLA